MFRSLARQCYLAFIWVWNTMRYPTCSVRTALVFPGVKLGRNVTLQRGVRVYGNTKIGDFTFINEGTQIEPNTNSIGKYCSISHGVKIGLGPHPLSFFTTSPAFYQKARGMVPRDYYDEYGDRGYARIGNDVLIGANAIVLAGVTIEDGAVVGTGSVVTRSVPAYAVVAGNPATIVKYRFGQATINRLLATRWWDRDPMVVARLAHLGFDIDEFIDALEGEVK